VIVQEGGVFPYAFSTKYQDSFTTFLYYGFRYHSPNAGRWLNRDPIMEAGGVNIFVFLNNSMIRKYDVLGLSEGDSSGSEGSNGSGNAPGNSKPAQACCILDVTRGIGQTRLQRLGAVQAFRMYATNTANNMYPVLARIAENLNLPVGTGAGCIRNAFRHCIGACALTKYFGRQIAWRVLECHESDQIMRNRNLDGQADFHNNTVGQRLATGNSSVPCATACLDALLDGELNLNCGQRP